MALKANIGGVEVFLSQEEESRILSERAAASIVTPEMVDAEAQRRIDLILPPTKRDETSLHGLALLMKGPENWNTADQAAVAAADALWDGKIKPIREKAEALKATEGGIPQDYTDDGYWS